MNSINEKEKKLNIALEELKNLDLTNPELQKEHKIVVVPTVIVFNDGEEVERFQANIMMQLEATKDEVQEAVDEIIMSAF